MRLKKSYRQIKESSKMKMRIKLCNRGDEYNCGKSNFCAVRKGEENNES